MMDHTSARRRLLTSHEVLRMMERGVFEDPDEHIELILGELVVSGGQGPVHRALVIRIHRAVDRLLGEEYHVADRAPILAGRYNLPEPDTAVVRGAVEDYFERLPNGSDLVLIAETSVTSQRDDRVKAAIYAAAEVPRYWQIDVPQREIVVHTEPDPERAEYRQVRVAVDGEQVELEGHSIPVEALLPPLSS